MNKVIPTVLAITILFDGCAGMNSGNTTGYGSSENSFEAERENGHDEVDVINIDSEESDSEEQIVEDVNLSEEESDESDGDMNKEPGILNFVDVFGEEYQVEIDTDIPKHSYNNDCFIHKDSRLSYIGDDRFVSRVGVDVSHHQGTIDWKKVKESGYEFCFLRIGFRGYGKEGKIREDKEFERNLRDAQEAGLDVGVYFFSQAINEDEAAEEANFVIEHLENKELQLPVVYDPESILDDVARTDDISGEQFTKNTVVFCNKIQDAGYAPAIYSNMLWEAYELDLKELEGIPVWYADYEEYPQTPYDFRYWQYTNEANINGIPGLCDADIELISTE